MYSTQGKWEIRIKLLIKSNKEGHLQDHGVDKRNYYNIRCKESWPVNCMELTQNYVQWHSTVMAVINFVLFNIRKCIYQLKGIKCSKKTLRHWVYYSFAWTGKQQPSTNTLLYRVRNKQFRHGSLLSQVNIPVGIGLLRAKTSFSSLTRVLINSSVPDCQQPSQKKHGSQSYAGNSSLQRYFTVNAWTTVLIQ
jgi:hypothetical protein